MYKKLNGIVFILSKRRYFRYIRNAVLNKYGQQKLLCIRLRSPNTYSDDHVVILLLSFLRMSQFIQCNGVNTRPPVTGKLECDGLNSWIARTSQECQVVCNRGFSPTVEKITCFSTVKIQNKLIFALKIIIQL